MNKKQSNKIIKPQRRNNKKSKFITLDFRFNKLKRPKRNKSLKNSSSFNKLNFLELVTRLQLIFVIIIVMMIVFNKISFLENFLKDEISVFGTTANEELVTVEDIEFDSETNHENIVSIDSVEIIENDDAIELNNSANDAVVSYLKGNSFDEIFRANYVVDSRAGVVNSMFDFEAFEKKDITLSNPTKKEPKVLIFHTHGSEQYKDSKDISEGVYLLGRTLESELEEKYGIETIHLEKRFDMVDGKTQIMGAYERMEPEINKILKENPSIEVVIDLHRDGLPGDMKQIVDIDGVKCAPLMFVNGLSSFNNKGTVEPLTNLYNPNLEDNLIFSYRLKQNSDKMYKGLVKDIYINAYRYSLFMKPKSLLLEVGAQNNTVEESVNAVKKFARVLAESLLQDN